MNSVKVLFNSIDNFIPTSNRYTETEGESGSHVLTEIHEEDEENLDLVETNTNEGENSDQSEKQDPKIGQNDSEKDTEDLIDPHYSIHLIFRFLMRLPYLILVEPLALFWRLLLLPFSYLLKPFELNYSYHVDMQEKTELIKHENLVLNTIKSPTSSSKYMIPPPQRLFPLVRNPQKRRRKTLILDLDETLIHSLSKGTPRTLNGNNSNTIEIKLNNIATLYHVHKRPYCDHFLKEISKWFDLHIFTASVREYADPIIDWLESDMIIDEKIFKKRYYRTDCTYRNGVGYIKDLSKFFASEELKNVVILDNSPVSYALHDDNAVMIEGWINDQNDKDLLNLLPMLHSLLLCIDVRFILGLRQGEKVFESYR